MSDNKEIESHDDINKSSENETYSMLKFIKPIYNNMVSGTDKYILGNVNLLCLNNTYYLKKDDKDNLKNHIDKVFGKYSPE